MKTFREQAGYSLIEVVVVMSMLGISATAGMGVMNYLFKGQADMKTKLASRDLIEDARGILGFSDICEDNFKDLHTGTMPLQVSSIKDNNGPRFVINGKYQEGSVQVQELSLRNFTLISGLKGRIDLSFRLKKLHDTGTVSEIYRKVPLMVTLNNMTDRQIATCHAVGAGGFNAEKSCVEMGGRYLPGSTPAENRCIFPQLVATDDTTLNSTNAPIHVRSGANDVFLSTSTGQFGVNYPLASVPTDAGTILSVNGDQRISGTPSSQKVMTEFLGVAPQANLEALSTQPGVPSGKGWAILESATGRMGFGEWYGDMWFDGGSDGVAHITNSGEQSNVNLGGMSLAWGHQAGVEPYPLNYPSYGTRLLMANDGRVGLGFNMETANHYPIPPRTGSSSSAPYAAAFDLNVAPINFTNASFFVQDSARVETDAWVTGNVHAFGVYGPSDRRWKQDVRPIKDFEKAIASIDGSVYRWKNSAERPSLPKGDDLGFIAQEVEMHFPEAVHTDSAGYKTLSYVKLLPVLWEAFKTRYSKNQELAKRVERLKELTCRNRPNEEICRQ